VATILTIYLCLKNV